ncbi:MAG: shikimate kinase, partial [Candidatus Adiutrix sp.]
MKNIVLIGLCGSGKSTLGQLAARACDLQFIDLDWEIEKFAQMTIKEIFKNLGETEFRHIESQILAKTLENQGALIATGGGVILREENMSQLKKAKTIFL